MLTCAYNQPSSKLQQQATDLLQANDEAYLEWINRPQETSSCVLQLEGHSAPVYCMAIHQDCLVSGSRDGQLRLWDLQAGRVTRVAMAHEFAINALLLVEAPNGSVTVVSASDDGSIGCYELTTLAQQRTLAADLG